MYLHLLKSSNKERDVLTSPQALKQGERCTYISSGLETRRERERERQMYLHLLKSSNKERDVLTSPQALKQGERETDVLTSPQVFKQGERCTYVSPGLETRREMYLRLLRPSIKTKREILTSPQA